jgi:hypothetical protein
MTLTVLELDKLIKNLLIKLERLNEQKRKGLELPDQEETKLLWEYHHIVDEAHDTSLGISISDPEFDAIKVKMKALEDSFHELLPDMKEIEEMFKKESTNEDLVEILADKALAGDPDSKELVKEAERAARMELPFLGDHKKYRN